MFNSNVLWILAAFVVYMGVMIAIGAKYMKSTKNSEDYFLGGRGLSGWVAALSAQASDMSGWLLMGLPGAVYAFGTGQAWIAIGLFIGTVCNWIFISGRLRRYTIRANNSLTLPEYFQNRFHDKKNVLLCISSIVIVVFFLVYTASAFAAGGKLFHAVTGVDYTVALTIGAVVILLYTFMGGFMAVCVTDFIQGMLMLVALLAVPLMAYAVVSGNGGLRELLDASGVAGGSDSYMSLWQNGGEPYRAIDIISQLAWGLGYCGMPHILTRFMAVKSQKELNKSKGIAIVWVALSLTFACIIGVVGRAYLYPEVLGSAGADSAENVFINMITHLFTKQYALPFVAGIFLCGILAAIMSTADSQLLVTASSVSEDIYKGVVNKEASDKKVLMVKSYYSSGSCDYCLYHCTESEQLHYGTGIQCMGRLWRCIWTTGSIVTILEAYEQTGSNCRNCIRWCGSYHLGLYSFDEKRRRCHGNTWNRNRNLFPSGRILLKFNLYRNCESLYQSSKRRNAERICRRC